MTKQEEQIQSLLAWIAILVKDNWNTGIKGEPVEDKRPFIMINDSGMYNSIKSRLDELRLSKPVRKLILELTTMVFVESEAVTEKYEGIDDSWVYTRKEQ